jgi:hypothetical protein
MHLVPLCMTWPCVYTALAFKQRRTLRHYLLHARSQHRQRQETPDTRPLGAAGARAAHDCCNHAYVTSACKRTSKREVRRWTWAQTPDIVHTVSADPHSTLGNRSEVGTAMSVGTVPTATCSQCAALSVPTLGALTRGDSRKAHGTGVQL